MVAPRLVNRLVDFIDRVLFSQPVSSVINEEHRMKLYSGLSPNGLRAGVFLAEKGIELPTVDIDIPGGQARTAAFRQKNSLGEVPVLELDDGTFLTESLAICRYLEALHPDPPLMGSSPLGIARVEMWSRRIEQQIMGPIAEVGRHTFTFFADKFEQVPEYAETQQRLLAKNLAWLDTELADGRTYVCDDAFSVADITGMAALMVCQFANTPVPEELRHVKRWETALCSRPTWPMAAA
ncbi:MAG: glutathione S-transferase family protein [Pseudomonadota bacterium]